MFAFACLDPHCKRCSEFWDRQLGITDDDLDSDEWE